MGPDQSLKTNVARYLPYILIAIIFLFHFGCMLFDRLGISLFRSGLDSPPMAWWPTTTIMTWLVQIGVIILMFVVFKSLFRGDPKWAIPTVVVCTLLSLAGIYLNSRYGVAVYEDSVLVRQLSFIVPSKARYKFADVVELHSDCEVDSGRGASTANPSYQVILGDGSKYDLKTGVDQRRYGKSWIDGLSVVDKALMARGIRAQVNPARLEGDYQRCLKKYSDGIDNAPLTTIKQVFVTDTNLSGAR